MFCCCGCGFVVAAVVGPRFRARFREIGFQSTCFSICVSSMKRAALFAWFVSRRLLIAFPKAGLKILLTICRLNALKVAKGVSSGSCLLEMMRLCSARARVQYSVMVS